MALEITSRANQLFSVKALQSARFLPRVRPPNSCPDGEIGKRRRLKIFRPKGFAGSSPAPGTHYIRKEINLCGRIERLAKESKIFSFLMTQKKRRKKQKRRLHCARFAR